MYRPKGIPKDDFPDVFIKEDWHVQEYQTHLSQRLVIVIGTNTEEVAYVPSQSDFDAAVISAAPAMLKTLARCVMALEANGAPNCEAAKEAKFLFKRLSKFKK